MSFRLSRRRFLQEASGDTSAASGMVCPGTGRASGIGGRDIRPGYVGVGDRRTRLLTCMFRHEGIQVLAVPGINPKAATRVSGIVDKAFGKRRGLGDFEEGPKTK